MSEITWVQDGDYETILRAKERAEERLADYIKISNSRYIIGESKLKANPKANHYKWGLYFIDNSVPDKEGAKPEALTDATK